MKNQKNLKNTELNDSDAFNFKNLPVYHPDMATERESFSPKSVEKKSYSFPVNDPGILAGENIIFDPTPIPYMREEEDESHLWLD